MTRHERLVEEYARDLRAAKKRAEAWWKDLEAGVRKEVGSKQLAAGVLQRRWPDGPASHPWVLAVVRKYWLACEALNEQIQREQGAETETPEPEYVVEPDAESPEADEPEEDAGEEEVYPHLFVLEWLMTDEFDDLADFLGSLSYWPIGLDEEERYT